MLFNNVKATHKAAWRSDNHLQPLKPTLATAISDNPPSFCFKSLNQFFSILYWAISASVIQWISSAEAA